MSVIIRLQGLPLSAAAVDIRNFFSDLRIPDGAVNIVGGSDGDAFIGFTTDEDARQAMRKNNGLIHDSEIRLFLSSYVEMKEVINNARYVPPISTNPSSLSPRCGSAVSNHRIEEEDPSRFLPTEDTSRYGRDIPPYDRNGPQLGKGVPYRYGSEEVATMTASHDGTRYVFGNETRFGDGKGEKGNMPMDGLLFDIKGVNNSSENTNQWKSDDAIGGHNAQWMNRDRVRHQDGQREGANKEESWRSENIRSFESMRKTHSSFYMSTGEEEEGISFFGRGTSFPKRSILPSPSMPSLIPSHRSSHNAPQGQKEEAFVELTRLPSDLLSPSLLEDFLSPVTPLSLSSVKVVYGPEGIHLHTLVRFTNAMDAFNALKKDGEQGVKIRPSTKEIFDCARDGRSPSFSHLPPSRYPPFPSFPPLPSTLPMGGMSPPAVDRPNLFTMPLINPNMVMVGDDRRGRDGKYAGRVEGKRKIDSPPRDMRQGMIRCMSPRPKIARGDGREWTRVCVQVSNLPFRVKEPEIRRMLGPGLNPYAIKKVFTEDNTPSDVWIMEFSSEPEAMETVQRRMELGGRTVRVKRIEETEADLLLKRGFKSPPRRGERCESLEEKVRLQEEAIELEKNRMNVSRKLSSGENALTGIFSAPVFTTNRGSMRGGRGMRGWKSGGRGGGRGGGNIGPGIERRWIGENNCRNCLIVSNIPPIPTPQALLEHLRIVPSQLVRVDKIASDGAILTFIGEKEAVRVAENANGELWPLLHGRRLVVAAMGRRQIEEELNLRMGGMGQRGNTSNHSLSTPRSGFSQMNQLPSRPRIDPHIVTLVGDPGCVISCDGFPRDFAIDEVKGFFDGFDVIESSVGMRMEGDEATGKCVLAMVDRQSARRTVHSLNGKLFRESFPISLSLLT